MTIELTRKPASATNGGEFDASLAQTVPVTTLLARNTSGITIQNAAATTVGSVSDAAAWILGSTGNTNNSITIPGNGYITTNTSDGSDNKSLTISGGGGGTSWNQNRGAGIVLQGNEVSGGEGELVYYAGNSGGTFGRHTWFAGGVIVGIAARTGAWTLGPDSGSSILHTIQAHSSGGNALTLFNRVTSDAGSGLAIKTNMSSGTFGAALVYVNASNVVGGYVSHNTGANTVSYTNSSDARLKTLFESFGGLELIEQMELKKYERLSDPGVKEIGFVAQELHEVFPQAVTVGGEDADTRPWGIDYGKLTPVLVKAIQELKAELDAAKARIAALEA
jgi:hypothetical protein